MVANVMQGRERRSGSAKIAVACCVNEQYALPLVVMLTSLVERLRPACEATVYLIHQRLSRETLGTVGAIVDTREVRLSGACLERLPQDRAFPPEAAAPLLLPEVLPQDLERVIFLDADMLVLDDIAPLWTIALEGRSLAAVVDPAVPYCRSPRGVKNWHDRRIPGTAAYFNAGVLLVDLETWRRQNVAGRAIEYIRAVGDRVDYLHQEALNATVWDDWLLIAARWNVSATAGRWFDPTEAAAVASPAIVHFAGRMKPWRMQSGSRFAPAYADVLSRVTSHMPRPAPTWRDRALGWYDRTLRSVCHPGERYLWRHRLL
jgi:lipopolysaccharide biosynthesis glycosyltransferase